MPRLSPISPSWEDSIIIVVHIQCINRPWLAAPDPDPGSSACFVIAADEGLPDTKASCSVHDVLFSEAGGRGKIRGHIT